jgi:DNA-binding NarL/FixJ family response regulator
MRKKVIPMKPLSVIVAQSNARTGDFLTKSLYNHFRVVHTTNNLDELLHSIPKHRADVAVVDLELADLRQVEQLTHQFSSTKIVCTHRLADEKMWADALAAGAADCCHSSDVRSIVFAASNIKPASHAHAA